MKDLESQGIFPELSLGELVEKFIEAFGESFGVNFSPAPWSVEDEAMVRERIDQFAPLAFPASATDSTSARGAVQAAAGRPLSRP